MQRDFEIGSRKFKLLKMDAIRQFHVVRKMGPILGDLFPALASIKKKGKKAQSEEEDLAEAAKVFTPIMNGLSKLSDADANAVLYGLLSCAELQQEQGNWMKVSNGEMLMANDMDFPVLIQIAGRAFMYNFEGFLGAPRGRS